MSHKQTFHHLLQKIHSRIELKEPSYDKDKAPNSYVNKPQEEPYYKLLEMNKPVRE